ncbi:MAG: peptidoglycan DD-metalloendopeptidase family protein [Clostridia bacterium]|nr:peptidoglycan DD-metalloendopeptidase family protein [Clostridia bacterium]
MEDKNEKKTREEGHHVRRRAVREPGKISTGTEKPAFEKEKDLFRRRSLRRHYAAFRRGGLGITDSLFNAFYIILTERSLEKEQKRAEKSGKAAAAEMNLMEHHAGGLRFLSSVLVRFRGFFSAVANFFLAPWKGKREGSRTHRNMWWFLKQNLAYLVVFLLTVAAGIYAYATLSVPVVLRAEIGGKPLGVVESVNVVDSAINELEDNVERILGKSFHFPHEIRYTFVRQREDTLTPKAEISDALYGYVQDSITTAAGLYVDDVLVAICESEEAIRERLDYFIAASGKGLESGIFNEISIVTQAYPTDKVVSTDTLAIMLQEMSIPLEDRKKDPDPDISVIPGLPSVPEKDEEEETVPAMVLIADTQYLSQTSNTPLSNQPQSYEDIKLDLYTVKTQVYDDIIPYRTEYQESSQHYTSMADVTTVGRNGLATVEAKIYYVNGKVAKREILSREVKKEPVTCVISVGTKLLPEEIGIRSFTTGLGRFIVPRVGFVYSYYGPREDGYHRGWDIPGNEGDNLYAAASGTVVVAIGQDGYFSNRPSNYYTGYGYCVVIEHENGFSTMYAHCSKINVTLGQKVKQGEKIAEVGNTGVSEGNHVHFEIMRGNTKVDPQAYLYRGDATIYD